MWHHRVTGERLQIFISRKIKSQTLLLKLLLLNQIHRTLWWGKFLLKSLVLYTNLALQLNLSLQLEMALSPMIRHQRLNRRSRPQSHKKRRLRITTWKKRYLNHLKIKDRRAQWCKKNPRQYLQWLDLQWSLTKLTNLQQRDKRQFQHHLQRI
jgi:hypothetical protein